MNNYYGNAYCIMGRQVVCKLVWREGEQAEPVWRLVTVVDSQNSICCVCKTITIKINNTLLLICALTNYCVGHMHVNYYHKFNISSCQTIITGTIRHGKGEIPYNLLLMNDKHVHIVNYIQTLVCLGFKQLYTTQFSLFSVHSWTSYIVQTRQPDVAWALPLITQRSAINSHSHVQYNYLSLLSY